MTGVSPSPDAGNRWQPHPVRAAALRAAAVVVPVLASVLVGAAVSASLPPASSFTGVLAQWTAVLGASTATAVLVERLTRRLLPLATLLKLSMLFPDQAPSRFKVARKVAGTRALAAELERARKAGVHGDRQQAAETILALVGMLGDYDSRTKGHSERTQLFVSMLADEMKLRPEDRDKLVWAALVHDIGKLEVATEVLNKPGSPDDAEWQQLRRHPLAGATICSPLQEWLGPWWHAIEQHHERHDGLGYPYGLSGSEISLGARIVSVADSYEVMTAARPYKRAMSASAARAELARCAGAQFDPVVVRAFLSISLGRLRWAAGPLAWLAQIPALQPISSLGPHLAPVLGKVAGVAAGAATAGAALVGLGLGPQPAAAAEAVAAPEQRQVQPDERPTSSPTDTPVPSTPTPTTVPTTAPVPTPSAAPAPVRPVPTSSPRPTGTRSPEPQPEPRPEPQPEPQPEPEPTTPPTTPPAPPANRAPTAVADSAGTAEDVPVDVDLLANDSDADGDALTAALTSGPAHGTATLVGGVLSYVPDADWNGTDQLTYTVSDGELTAAGTVAVTVTPVADAPVAGADAATTPEDTTTTVDLLANDTDADGDALTATVSTGPAHGTATIAGGVLSYVPDADWNGTDQLTYTVSDGGLSDSGAVALTVTPVADAPVAGADAATTPEDTTTTVDLLANDTDADGDTLTAAAASDPANGTATITAGVLTYEPDADWNGTDSLTYTVSDPGGATSTATVTVTVTPVDDAPDAVDDGFAVEAGSVLTGNVLANDDDMDGDPLVVVSDDSPDVTVAADGSFTWTPPSPGVRTFTYTVSDGALTGTATVTITVTAAPPTNGALFLRGSATGVRGAMTLGAPGASGDWDGDGNPGTTLKDSGLDEDEDDPRKFLEWDHVVPAGGLALDGPVSLDLSSRTRSVGLLGERVDYSVWLYRCGPGGTGCTRIAATEDVRVGSWGLLTGYQQRTLLIGTVHTTLAPGEVLRVRLMVDHEDLLIPLDGAHPSRLVWTAS